jgi:putative component of membrane protein insertase Oxa1/YidC/SpoIIIJ protein YidD
MNDNALPQAMLQTLIRFYRRRLSGRGVFRHVRCTFTGLESCSAFGERIAREAPSTWAAICRILRRLKRCRHLSLFRFPSGALGWGRGYDALLRAESARDTVRNLDDALIRDGENAEVRAAAREAALLVLMHNGTFRGRRVPRSPLLLRDASAVRRMITRRLYSRTMAVLFFAAVAMVVTIAGFRMPFVAPFWLAGAVAALSMWASRRLLARLERLELLADIEGPFSDELVASVVQQSRSRLIRQTACLPSQALE